MGAIPVVLPDTREVVGIVSYVDVLRAVRELVVRGMSVSGMPLGVGVPWPGPGPGLPPAAAGGGPGPAS